MAAAWLPRPGRLPIPIPTHTGRRVREGAHQCRLPQPELRQLRPLPGCRTPAGLGLSLCCLRHVCVRPPLISSSMSACNLACEKIMQHLILTRVLG